MATRLDSWLAACARSRPDHPALITGSRTTSWSELERAAARAALALAEHGVGRGSLVALEARASAELVVLLHALMRVGAVAYPLSPSLSAQERRRLVDPLEPALAIADPAAFVGASEPLPGRPFGESGWKGDEAFALDDPLCRILTSGTSGPPRAIALSYGNHLWSAVGSALNLGVRPEDRWLCCLPLHHVSGFSILIRSAIQATTTVLHDGFDVERVARSLERDAVTVLSLVPTQLARLVEAGAAISGPRAILVGGGPVPAELLEAAAGRGATVVQTYGLTEACSQVATLAPGEALRRIGSAGRPLATSKVRVAGGEIEVFGPTVAPGCAGPDGWLRTGDLGRIDEQGFLYVTGRASEVISTGGETVVPYEVEQVLAAHPTVAEAAVVGRPDPVWQEAVTALLVAAEGATPSAGELAAHCRASLSPFKVPKSFELVESLPRTASGKLRRGELREARGVVVK